MGASRRHLPGLARVCANDIALDTERRDPALAIRMFTQLADRMDALALADALAPRLNLATLYLRLGRDDEARAELDRARARFRPATKRDVVTLAAGIGVVLAARDRDWQRFDHELALAQATPSAAELDEFVDEVVGIAEGCGETARARRMRVAQPTQ